MTTTREGPAWQNDAGIRGLIWLAAHLEGSTSREAARWRKAIDARFAGDGASLDELMQIRSVALKARRDALLASLRNPIITNLRQTLYAGMSPTAASQEIEARWERYAAIAWPRDRKATANPYGDRDCRRFFFDAMKVGAEPISASTIRGFLDSR